MAKGGDKKRLEENRAHIRKLQILIAVANVSFGSRAAPWLLRPGCAGRCGSQGPVVTTASSTSCKPCCQCGCVLGVQGVRLCAWRGARGGRAAAGVAADREPLPRDT